MVQNLLMGIGAGAASAMLLLAAVYGPSSAIVLVIFAGLPLLIAAIGWSHRAALAGIAVMALLLGLTLQSFLATGTIVLTIGAPAWWLGYLVMLARPNATGGLEWYPSGNLVVWCALLAAATVALAIPFYGTDEASVQAAMRSAFERAMRLRAGTPADEQVVIPGVSDPGPFIELLVIIAPLVSAAIGTVVNLLNLWLAGVITRVSGRLNRPWPELPSMRFPPYAFAIAAVSLALSFVSGILGIFAGIVATAMLVAYAVLGLAVFHAVTRDMKNRGFILGVFYVGLFLLSARQGWPIMIVTLIGFADALFNLRARLAAWRGLPPPAHT
jgi:hypothetical protein